MMKGMPAWCVYDYPSALRNRSQEDLLWEICMMNMTMNMLMMVTIMILTIMMTIMMMITLRDEQYLPKIFA